MDSNVTFIKLMSLRLNSDDTRIRFLNATCFSTVVAHNEMREIITSMALLAKQEGRELNDHELGLIKNLKYRMCIVGNHSASLLADEVETLELAIECRRELDAFNATVRKSPK